MKIIRRKKEIKKKIKGEVKLYFFFSINQDNS